MPTSAESRLESQRARYAMERGLSLRSVGATRQYCYYILHELDDQGWTLAQERQAVREQIALERGLNADTLELRGNLGCGRVYHAAVCPRTGRGLIFATYHGPRATRPDAERCKYEEKDLQKFARSLGIPKVEVLAPLYLIESEIKDRLTK